MLIIQNISELLSCISILFCLYDYFFSIYSVSLQHRAVCLYLVVHGFCLPAGCLNYFCNNDNINTNLLLTLFINLYYVSLTWLQVRLEYLIAMQFIVREISLLKAFILFLCSVSTLGRFSISNGSVYIAGCDHRMPEYEFKSEEKKKEREVNELYQNHIIVTIQILICLPELMFCRYYLLKS